MGTRSVDVRNTKVTDMFKQGVLEPLVVKAATEVASMLLKIDNVIAGSPKCLLYHLEVVVEEWAVWPVCASAGLA
jgi:hypothetical protein